MLNRKLFSILEFGLVAALMLGFSGIAFTQGPSVMLSVTEKRRAAHYETAASNASAQAAAISKEIASIQKLGPDSPTDDRMRELSDRLKAANARQSEAESLLRNWETQIMEDHQADPKKFKANWIKGVIEKR